MAKITKEEEMRQQNVAEAVSKAEVFFKENSKIIYGCVIAVLVIALCILCYNRFILTPKKAEAQQQMFHAEQWFAEGNYELALAGDDNYLGFEDVIDKYGAKGGTAVYLYAGEAKLHLGEFEEAIKYLKKYSGKDNILSARAEGCIGDAYVGLEDYKTAINWFCKAAKTSDNVFSALYLKKAGIAAEALGNNDEALSYYKEIKDRWPGAFEASDIDKFITRIEK